MKKYGINIRPNIDALEILGVTVPFISETVAVTILN